MIGIYRLTSGCTTYAWLCAKHLEARKADAWTAEKTGDVDGDCRDCELERQASAAYHTSPAVDFVPTASNHRHIPAKGAPETIGKARKVRKQAPGRAA